MSAADDSPSVVPPVRNRSTRDRPAKAPLSEEAVIDAALAILKSEGLEAVTMRGVARALDTGAASLYVYVAGREGLLEAMLERVIATIELEAPDPARWREQMHALLERMHEALVAHPGIGAVVLVEPPRTEAVLKLSENVLAILLAGGLDPQDAAWVTDILLTMARGVANEDDVRRPRGRSAGAQRDERVGDLYEMFAGLPPEQFPSLAAHPKEMVSGDDGERFHFAIDAVLNGVLAGKAQG